jgi:hypothetical protein
MVFRLCERVCERNQSQSCEQRGPVKRPRHPRLGGVTVL